MSTRSGPGWSGEIGGSCPVQGHGVVDGAPWYFRARWESWMLGVAVSPGCDPVCVDPGDPDGFWYGEVWGEGPFDAGYMPDDDAWSAIERGVEAYRDPLARLVHIAHGGAMPPLSWAVGLSAEEGRDPLAVAWARCTLPSVMVSALLLARHELDAVRRALWPFGLYLVDGCEPCLPEFAVDGKPTALALKQADPRAYRRAIAAAIRAAVPAPPSLDALVGRRAMRT